MLSEKFLQGVIFDRDRIRQAFPGKNTNACVDTILGILPRELYKYVAAGNVDGKLTVVVVLNTGDDEEYLRKTLKIPDDNTFRQAVHYCMEPGVWPTHK